MTVPPDLPYVSDFLAALPARHAQPVGVILELRCDYAIMRLKVYRSGSVNCIWEIPDYGFINVCIEDHSKEAR